MIEFIEVHAMTGEPMWLSVGQISGITYGRDPETGQSTSAVLLGSVGLQVAETRTELRLLLADADANIIVTQAGGIPDAS